MSLLFDLGQRDGWVCYLCGGDVPQPGVVPDNHADAPSLDHVVPQSRGGSRRVNNLFLTHKRCNTSRGHAPLTREQALRLEVARAHRNAGKLRREARRRRYAPSGRAVSPKGSR